MGGILRKIALAAGFRQLLAWIRAAHEGKRGPQAQVSVAWCLKHAGALGLVLGCLVAGLGIHFGPDSQVVGVFTGFVSAVLLPAGMVPAYWQSTPESLARFNWYALARNNAAELGALLAAWGAYNTGSCSAAGGLDLGPLMIPCGLSAFAHSFVFGTFTHLGILSAAALAPAPEVPIPVQVKAP